MLIRTLIVDDEIMARKHMERLALKNESLTVVGICENGEEGVKFLTENEVDLILLDVEMPKLNGFELLEQLQFTPHIIMTTTKEDYAYDAYQYQIFAYLKKPVTIPIFNTTIDKLVNSLKGTRSGEKKDHIFFKVDSKLVRVEYLEIKYIENVGDYVKVVTADNTYVVHASMRSLSDKLPEELFMRVHRSYIVNLKSIVDIEQNSLQLKGKIIPVSRAAKPDLMSKLNLL